MGNKWGCAKERKRREERELNAELLFVHRTVEMNVSTIHENYGRDYDRGWNGGEEREETQTDNAKKSRKIGRSTAPWSKESLKRVEEEEGGAAGLLFFATLSSPTGRKYIRRCTVPERMPLEIRRGKILEKKKKQGIEETRERCRRNERHTSALLPGSFFRNKPSSLSLSLALRFWKEIST